MNYEIQLTKQVLKFLNKLEKSTPREHAQIVIFLNEKLSTSENPCKLPNAKHLTGFVDNRYRWRLGDYRIIAKVINDEIKVIKIIRVAKRDESTYKNLK